MPSYIRNMQAAVNDKDNHDWVMVAALDRPNILLGLCRNDGVVRLYSEDWTSFKEYPTVELAKASLGRGNHEQH